MVVGGSIIIPIDISTDETTISITINGMYIKKPNIKAVLSSLSIKGWTEQNHSDEFHTNRQTGQYI